MRIFLFSTVIVILSACASSPEDFTNGLNSDFNLPTYNSNSLDNEEIKLKTSFIYTLLGSTSELNIHRMNGEDENQVFVNDDGREAVFDKNEQLVQNCANKGSYNYYHPTQKPLGHFSTDSLPWLMWGNCRKAETTKQQRIEAYIKDINEGLLKSLSSGIALYLPNEFDFSSTGQSQTTAFFILAIEHNGFDLTNFIQNDLLSEEEQRKFIAALNEGLMYMLENA